MALWPSESKPNQVQSLAIGGCGSGGVTDRHAAAWPGVSQHCGIMGDWSAANSTRKGLLLVPASWGELRKKQLSHSWEANVEDFLHFDASGGWGRPDWVDVGCGSAAGCVWVVGGGVT